MPTFPKFKVSLEAEYTNLLNILLQDAHLYSKLMADYTKILKITTVISNQV